MAIKLKSVKSAFLQNVKKAVLGNLEAHMACQLQLPKNLSAEVAKEVSDWLGSEWSVVPTADGDSVYLMITAK